MVAVGCAVIGEGVMVAVGCAGVGGGVMVAVGCADVGADVIVAVGCAVCPQAVTRNENANSSGSSRYLSMDLLYIAILHLSR
jgi:hypothetical protein